MLFGNKVKDPVCGMEIKVNDSTLRFNFNDTEYYFCSSDCLKQFQNDPGKYAAESDDCCQKGEHEHHHHDAAHQAGHCCGGKGHGHHQHQEHCCQGHGDHQHR